MGKSTSSKLTIKTKIISVLTLTLVQYEHIQEVWKCNKKIHNCMKMWTCLCFPVVLFFFFVDLTFHIFFSIWDFVLRDESLTFLLTTMRLSTCFKLSTQAMSTLVSQTLKHVYIRDNQSLYVTSSLHPHCCHRINMHDYHLITNIQ